MSNNDINNNLNGFTGTNEIIMTSNNNNNNIITNYNGTVTGLQGSIGDLDINANDVHNIFNQNLGNTNINIETYEEYNPNVNSNVNPIGSGEIPPQQNQDSNNNNVNNQNDEENK